MSEPENTTADGSTVESTDDGTTVPSTDDRAVPAQDVTTEPSGPRADVLAELEGPKLLPNYRPSVGDYCTVDGQVGKIEVFDTAANIFTALIQDGNSINRITNHITHAQFQPLHDDGTHRVGTDGLDDAVSQATWVSNPYQESVDEGLTRVQARQGDQFTSAVQQGYIARQPHAGDSPELVRAKWEGDVERVTELQPTDSSTAGRADSAPVVDSSVEDDSAE